MSYSPETLFNKTRGSYLVQNLSSTHVNNYKTYKFFVDEPLYGKYLLLNFLKESRNSFTTDLRYFSIYGTTDNTTGLYRENHLKNVFNFSILFFSEEKNVKNSFKTVTKNTNFDIKTIMIDNEYHHSKNVGNVSLYPGDEITVELEKNVLKKKICLTGKFFFEM